jgi:hypothetical protein
MPYTLVRSSLRPCRGPEQETLVGVGASENLLAAYHIPLSLTPTDRRSVVNLLPALSISKPCVSLVCAE